MKSLLKPAVAWTIFCVLLAVWSMILLLTRNHGCTGASGSISCDGLLATLGFYNLLFGWVPVTLALFFAGAASLRKLMSSRPQQ